MKNNCTDNKSFKYARLELTEDLKILVDADEYPYIKDYYSTSEDKRIDFENRDLMDHGEFKIIYGAIFKPENSSLDEALIEAKRCVGHSLGYINYDEKVCDISWLADLKIYKSSFDNKAPFAALIKTTLEFSDEPLKEKTLFTRYLNLTCIKNIINRPYILSCAYEIRGYELHSDNWIDSVDENKVIKVFNNIK